MTLAKIKYHISKGGKGTKKTRGVNTTISTMLVIPIMLNELWRLTIVLQVAWHSAANKINKKTIEVFKLFSFKFFNN